MKTKLFLQLGLLVAVAAPAAAQANPDLVVNGSFELPAFSSNTWGVYASIPGWTSTTPHGIEVQRNVAGASAHGFQHVELDAYSSSGMYQNVATQPGRAYTFRFAYSPRPGTADSKIRVLVDGVALVTLDRSGAGKSQTDWAYSEYTIVAQGATTRIQFEDASVSDGYGGYIDHVSMVLAPVSVNALFDQTKGHKSGSTIPVKVQLFVEANNISSEDLPVSVGMIYKVGSLDPINPQDSGNSNAGGLFRYDPLLGDSGGYIFNLKTTGLTPGNYKLTFTVPGDTTVYFVEFRIR
jgi:hypothetical protein